MMRWLSRSWIWLIILKKLNSCGVTAMSPIRRRVWPGTNVYDGTRFLKVKFPGQVKSLPYSTKFDTESGSRYFRVIHDKQVKVCRLCLQPDHILRDCPEFLCNKCKKQRHYARECGVGVEKCGVCFNNTNVCICNESSDKEDLIGGKDTPVGFSLMKKALRDYNLSRWPKWNVTWIQWEERELSVWTPKQRCQEYLAFFAQGPAKGVNRVRMPPWSFSVSHCALFAML